MDQHYLWIPKQSFVLLVSLAPIRVAYIPRLIETPGFLIRRIIGRSSKRRGKGPDSLGDTSLRPPLALNLATRQPKPRYFTTPRALKILPRPQMRIYVERRRNTAVAKAQSKVNAMTLTYNVARSRHQKHRCLHSKIDGSALVTYKMVLAGFSPKDNQGKDRFFEETSCWLTQHGRGLSLLIDRTLQLWRRKKASSLITLPSLSKTPAWALLAIRFPLLSLRPPRFSKKEKRLGDTGYCLELHQCGASSPPS